MEQNVEGKRANKSQRIVKQLKSISNRPLSAKNPYEKELNDAAKHIEWLELIVTGLSYADKCTIAKLQRRVGTLQRMVERRDEKLRGYNDWHTYEIQQWRKEVKQLKKAHKRELKKARKISSSVRHQIEKDFIKGLKTNHEIQKAIATARWNGGIEANQRLIYQKF